MLKYEQHQRILRLILSGDDEQLVAYVDSLITEAKREAWDEGNMAGRKQAPLSPRTPEDVNRWWESVTTNPYAEGE